jgi:hypothetical protein
LSSAAYASYSVVKASSFTPSEEAAHSAADSFPFSYSHSDCSRSIFDLEETGAKVGNATGLMGSRQTQIFFKEISSQTELEKFVACIGTVDCQVAILSIADAVWQLPASFDTLEVAASKCGLASLLAFSTGNKTPPGIKQTEISRKYSFWSAAKK